MASGSILGNAVLRTEDHALLTEGGMYVDDQSDPRLGGALHVVYVRSSMAHAELTGIDVSEARQAPGVVAVFTGHDIDLAPLKGHPFLNQAVALPFLATGTVHFVGQPIVAVVAETRARAVDAAEMVVIDYQPLQAVVDPEAARTDRLILHPAAGTNTVFRIPGNGDAHMFDDCEVVVTERIVNQRLAPVPMEPRAAAAVWKDGRLTQWACSQGAHGTRDSLATALGLEKTDVQVIVPDVGGGFGAKHGDQIDEMLVGWLARKLDRPVRFVETRTENLMMMVHGRGQVQTATMGGTRDGQITHYRLDILQDAGAYLEIGGVLPFMTAMMAPGVYDIGKVDAEITSVVTTTTPTGAYRGAGRPEASAAIERVVDRFAAEIGMDPVEVRRRNLVKPEQFPFTTARGTVYDCGNYEAALDKALEAAGYDDLRAEQSRRRANGDTSLLGIGVSVYVEITNPLSDTEFGAVTIRPDGSALVRTGSSSHGQGHHTAWAMIVHEQTGIAMDRIEVRHGDTDEVPSGTGTGGSKSLQIGGMAVMQASDDVVKMAKEQAADLLEAAVDDIVLDTANAAFHVQGSPSVSKSWAELAASATEPLAAEAMYKASAPTFPFGAHVCVVEVDRETGRVVVVRYVACDDAGRILNPLIVDGQVHGGLAQGIAQALMEEVRYDEAGNPVTSNLADYAAISATELPSFERIPMETPTPINPLGVKGIGEAGTIGATPAVHNAVIDAVAHLGVRHIDMPCTPEKVWRAIR
jgi:aerobic carbon-monoxide dehydrogenase large subunit